MIRAADVAGLPCPHDVVEGADVEGVVCRLHRAFFDARGPVGPSAAGEAKQARQWLDRLAAETH